MGGVIRSGIGDIFLAWSEHGCSKGEKKDTMMEVGEENIIRQSTESRLGNCMGRVFFCCENGMLTRG